MDEKLLILSVEDDANDALLLKRAFIKNGINNPVHTSPDGADAIAYLQGHGRYQDRSAYPFPGVVISDIKMPRVNGLELLQWLRSHPECQVIPVLILSGSRLDEDIRAAYRLGVNAYLHKPSSFEELVETMGITFKFWKICQKPAPIVRCA